MYEPITYSAPVLDDAKAVTFTRRHFFLPRRWPLYPRRIGWVREGSTGHAGPAEEPWTVTLLLAGTTPTHKRAELALGHSR